jgi:hypothetical protein
VVTSLAAGPAQVAHSLFDFAVRDDRRFQAWGFARQ